MSLREKLIQIPSPHVFETESEARAALRT